MTTTHGFDLIREQEIHEIKTLARFYRHLKTGAELLSLVNGDTNKVFGITFRTPPSDSTGIAHILEHSVLCGSRKYPVKEPFVELLKGSLKTFLNAFTYPDKTCYPVASQNLQDFYNLIDVYMDAVLYPRLTPFVFQQEGWHFELEDPDNPLSYKGVVFNEMKGAYSSPDSVLSEYSIQSIFPDNTYGFDSGGSPKKIPDLTFEQFKAFHERYYHPSNAMVFFCGDDDPENRLTLINDYFKNYESIQIDSTIRLQPPFKSPRYLIRPFMVGNDDSDISKGMVTLNWLLPETTAVKTNFALRILNYILLGMPASPLRKALIDSGLGEDIAGEGLGTELRQIYFSTGLKGIKTEDINRIESLIMDTLRELAKKGIDPLTVEAALNTVEFRSRENNPGSFPQGLVLMLRSLTTWLYEGDPLALLAFEGPLKEIKAAIESKSPVFEEMIDRLLVNNSHRTTLTFKPDPELRQRDEAEEKDALSRARSRMSAKDLEAVVNNTRELKRLQETPDTSEALSTIPVLKLSDLDKKNKPIPLAVFERHGTPILFHDLSTNGIVYFDLGFNLHTLPEKYLPYVPLFGRALVEIGTEKEDYVSLTQRISRKTGGIGPQSFISSVKDSKRSAARLFLRGKAMLSQTEEMINIFRDMLLSVQLDNQERFRQIALKSKSRAEDSLVPNGHQMVNLRIRAHFGESHWAAEQLGGISHIFFLRELVQAIEEDWNGVLAVLEEIRRILVNRKTMIANITLDQNNWPSMEPLLFRLLDSLPERPPAEMDWSPKPSDPFEGMTIPAQVNYVGKGANLYELGYRFHGSALVITRFLRNAWLWDQVRVQGGAYGAFCILDRPSGVLTFVSYRDPNLAETLRIFDHSAQFLSDTEFSEEELAKGIIGAIGDLDAHMLPDARGYISMIRYLKGDKEEILQQMRDEILDTKASDYREFARLLGEVGESGLVKVLGSPDAIEASMADRPGWLNVFQVL